MASSGGPEDIRYGDRASTNPDTSAAEAALKARLSRRRTKTGCLTCRKRRIKCGEERPVCKNCIKSKRQCEGYSQRVVFKEPTIDYQPIPNGGAHITFQAGSLPGPLVPYDREYGHVIADPSIYSQQQSNPTGQYTSTLPNVAQRHAGGDHHQAYFAPVPGPQGGLPYHPDLAVVPNATYHQTLNGTHVPHHRSQSLNSSEVYSGQSQSVLQPVTYASQAPVPPGVLGASQQKHHTGWQQPYAVKFENWPMTSPTTNAIVGRVPPTTGVSNRNLSWSQPFAAATRHQGWSARPHMAPPESPHTFDGEPLLVTSRSLPTEIPVTIASALQAQNPSPPELYEHEQHLPMADTTNNLLSQAAVESQDDDYYDVDEEMDVDTLAVATLDHEQKQNLQRILQMSNSRIHDAHTRRYDTFIYEGMLDRYRVEEAASPLKNPATARVFAHFISVTAPSISVFERHARKAPVLFKDGQIPISQRGLWTYTMPLAALHHQGLLHSMLALASLHIARLQNASDTPSRQHYAWACKRINHLLEPNSKKRHKTTTIAASMLLGFYEIFTADHRAWNLHLTGSRQLVAETDFLSMSRQFRRMKRERTTHQQIAVDPTSARTYSSSQDEILDQAHDVDEKLISHLCGKKVDYDEPFPMVTPQSGIPKQLDLNNFEILRDLYFWYLKQDAVQCLLSGNPLLLDFHLWANCAPRAPLGRADAVYGSFDHLVLLMGRIADFASTDRRRKLRQMEANGGQWKPAPGMKMPQTQGQQRSQPTTPMSATNGQPPASGYFPGQPPPQPPPPQFFGMAPPPRDNVQMPSAYYPATNVQTPHPVSPQQDEPDLRAATNAALEEYGRIRAALHEFKNNLGEAFDPLPDEYQVPLESPFGNALIYRSYDISCLWAWYYTAVIVAIRSHPHMHPAAHAAAAIAAQETAFFANEIGRIHAGILPGPSDQPINPTLGAALWDSCVPSFFAAIQYQDPLQRHATVMRIHNIGVRTGWGTAETIANGCETAWVKAAAAGRGPPYTRIVRREFSDDPRLNGRGENLDPQARPNENDDDGKDGGRDRTLVKTKAEARLTWAIGILGTEEDESSKATKLT